MSWTQSGDECSGLVKLIMSTFSDQYTYMTKRKISASRERMIRSGIAYLRFKGFHEIKAGVDEFKEPQLVFNRQHEIGFQPDVIAYRNFATFIFDTIEDQDLETWGECCQKWEVFEEFALRKKGKLGLIIYSDQAELIKERLANTALDPTLIQIKKQVE